MVELMKIIDLEKWSPLVGKFVIEFGAAESFLDNLLREHTTEEKYNHAKNLSLSKRIPLIINLIKKSTMENDLSSALITTLKRIDNIRHPRNIIAHNTVKLVFWVDSEPSDDPYEEALFSDKNEDIITYQELIHHVNEITECVESLYMIDAEKRGRRIKSDLEFFKIAGIEFKDVFNGIKKDK